MRPLTVLAQTVDPLAAARDGVDPLRWLPAWRWTRVNDIWSHRGGGLFSAIKNAVLGVLDIGVNSGFFLASLLWEITTTVLSWALTPHLFTAFEGVGDTTGLRLLDALGFTNAINGATVFAAILLAAVLVGVIRFARNPVAGIKTMLRSFIPLAICAVLVGTTVAEINNTARSGQTGTAAPVVPGSLKWLYRTLDNGRSLLVEGVVESAALFSSVGDPPGTVYGCDSYLKALESLYRQDAVAAGWRGAQIETPVVVSRMWQAVYLDQFSAAQVGVHSSKRAGCWTAEVREDSVAPIEVFAVWDHTCGLDAEHHLYGCVQHRLYDAAQIQRAEAVFAPSEFDPHEWRSALTLWAVCDWRGRPSTSHIGGRDDLTPGAQRTLLEMANMRGGTVYDGKALAMLASPLWSRSEAIYDPAFVGLRNARDSDKYLSAETCANYRFADPNTAQTPNDDRDGAWGLWAKWVTDRANIEPDDGADSRRHALGMGSGDAPDSQDRSIQKDTVDSINGASWTGRLLYSAVTILTAALYGFSLAGMGLGTLIAQFLVGGIVAVMPLLLVLMALPVQAAQQLPRKVFKLLIGSLFAHLIFLFILSLGIMCIGILNQVLGGLTGNFLVRSMLFAFVPLISLFAVNGLTKQFGLKIISPKGAMLATTGIALAAMRPPNLNVSQFAGRARSRYEQISDRADVRRETDRLEARSGESRVRTQPRMRAPDSGEPALALNSKSSPAAIAAGALATMGSRLPRGTGRRPGVASTPGRPGAPLTPPTGSGDSGVVLPRASGGSVPPIVAPPPPAVSPAPPPQPTGEDAPQVAAPPEPALRPSETPTPPPAILSPSVPAAPPTDVAAPAARTEPTSVVPPRRPFEPVDPGPSTYANMRTQPPRPDHADTEVAEGEHHGDVGPAKGPRLAESVEMAAVRAGRAAKATQWGALKAGRWVRDHRRAIKRVAVGSLIAMGAVGMSAAAAPLAVGYAGAKFIGWRYRRQLQAAHLVRTPQERAEERVERREHRHTKRQDREMRVEQRVRRRAEGPGESAPSALSPTSVVAPRRPHLPSGPSTRPPTSVVAPRGADPRGTAATPASQVRIPEIPAVNPERATAEPAPSDEPEPSLSPEPEPAPAPQAGSPTEMTAAQAGYLTGLAESTGLDPSAVFEAVAGDRLRASEAIDVLRGGAPADGDEGTLMDRVIAVTSRVRLPSPRPEGPAVEA